MYYYRCAYIILLQGLQGKEAKWKSPSIWRKHNEEVKTYIFVCSFVKKETQEGKPDIGCQQRVIRNRDKMMGVWELGRRDGEATLLQVYLFV